ncbi:hypothetical protein XELAEV_18021644mg [Xenopus laevis]|uniref:Uncharacterized protein n=1 Tax=Xenopus laevis TaxID=8355 RepID=A0A974DBI9_XENLA|nr:hypothetical protein XELAEV_18021644mg [Xenopus laevis]
MLVYGAHFLDFDAKKRFSPTCSLQQSRAGQKLQSRVVTSGPRNMTSNDRESSGFLVYPRIGRLYATPLHQMGVHAGHPHSGHKKYNPAETQSHCGYRTLMQDSTTVN